MTPPLAETREGGFGTPSPVSQNRAELPGRPRAPRDRLRAALGRVWGIALLEIRLNLLSPGPWVMGLVLATLGYLTVRTATDPSSFRLGWSLSYEYGPLTGVLLLFLAASFAHRPERYEITELQDSKVVASEELILGRWLGMVAGVLVPLLLQYAVTMAGQMIHSKLPVAPLAYVDSLGRLLPSVFFLATLSFCLVAITRILVLGAGLAGLLWFILYFGKAEYPGVLRLELTQNRWVFLGLTGAVLLWMLLGYRGRRRAKRAPLTYGLAVLTGLAFSATLLHATWAALAIPSKASAVAVWRRLGDPRGGGAARPAVTEEEPLPNFAWVDQHGRRVSLAGLRGKPALLLFFQPRDDGLPTLLRRFSRLQQEMAKPEGGQPELQVVGVCLSEDLGVAAQAARLAGADLPLVTDWGAPAGADFDRRQPPSAVSWALRVQSTPLALLLDEQGREKLREPPPDETRWQDWKNRLRGVLSGEIEPEEKTPSAPAPEGSPR